VTVRQFDVRAANDGWATGWRSAGDRRTTDDYPVFIQIETC
jgi:hypothetical protein